VLRDVPSAHGYRGGFNAGFMSKDLRLALQLAGTARQPLPMGERAAQLYQQVRRRTAAAAAAAASSNLHCSGVCC
jgi:3-hydroxyisobutyrate dehydrogenase